MPGFFGFTLGDIGSNTTIPVSTDSANENFLVRKFQWEEHGYNFTSFYRKNNPLSGSMLYVDSDWIGLFSGDLVEYDKIPWKAFIEAIDSRDTQLFASMNGVWAVALIDRRSSTQYLISDRRCQHPLYYDIHNKKLRFSTELSAFCRLSSSPSFNVEWLYEILFFHFPIANTTFLTNVQRMPPASILEYDLLNASINLLSYHEPFEAHLSQMTDKETLTRTQEIFSSRIPVYVPKKTPWAAAVTGGWDARTILSYSIDHKPVSYTYGIPGCGDLLASRHVARKLGISHREILLDQEFRNQLSDLMFDTVFLSDGYENCFRASLLHVYNKLTDKGNTFPVVLSGIGLDSMFRGHLGPALVSPEMKRIFGGEADESENPWVSLVKDYSNFVAHNNEKVDALLERIGDPNTGSTHLLYFLYEIAPKYYGGELNIARHFTTLRMPALDHEIIQLSLSTRLSTISYSNFLSTHKRGDFSEEILQAYLLSNSPRPAFSYLPICGVPPFALLHGRKAYNALKILYKIQGRLLRMKREYRISAPQEQNIEWYNSLLKDEVQTLLFSNETMITEYLNLPPLSELATVENQHLFKKLLTAEIVIRLVKNGWQKFW